MLSLTAPGAPVLRARHSPFMTTLKRYTTSRRRYLENLFLTDDTSRISLLVLLLVISIPVSVVGFNRVMHAGHPTSFSPSDSARSGFTKGPKSRGTANILSACSSTIFTCVYVSLHLNVPTNGSDPQPSDWWGKCRSLLVTVRRKGLWMTFNIIAPELIVYVAIAERLSAEEWVKRMKRRTAGRWTLAHAFFADMGGFKVRLEVSSQESSPETRVSLDADSDSGSREVESWQNDLEDRVSDQAQNIKLLPTPAFNEAGADPTMRLEIPKTNIFGPCVIMQSGQDFYRWFDSTAGLIDIDYEQLDLDIRGMRQADWLLKTLTCIHASWLVVQTLVRAIENRPVSELEATTCAYVMCALITYIAWWDKPYGVQTHIVPNTLPSTKPDWTQNTLPTPTNRIRDDAMSMMDDMIASIFGGCIGAVIGAIHCFLWNAEFANSNGQLVWRICCIVQIVAPLVTSLLTIPLSLIYLMDSEHYNSLVSLTTFIYRLSYVTGFIYCCARIVLFILIGYSFRSLPVGVYTDIDWTWHSFPHWH